MQRTCWPAHGSGLPSCAAHTKRSSYAYGDEDPAHFAATFKVGKFRAVEVARDEEYKEGSPFWFCSLLEHLSPLAPSVVVGDSFDEGWWIVKIQWLTYAV